MKKCPYCKEKIKDDAIKCKHCTSMIPEYDIELLQSIPSIEKDILRNGTTKQKIRLIGSSICMAIIIGLILIWILKFIGVEIDVNWWYKLLLR